ncbi:hypothetical protein ASF30_01940 [Leifsonia sp. Leaf264]|nr:hypothetical protein ASF30_01940 [Leifsonia sp. Leaf264]
MVTCSRCGNTERSVVAGKLGWNTDARAGVIVAIICSGCQTAEENAEAEINLATTRYSVDAFGRMVGFARI